MNRRSSSAESLHSTRKSVRKSNNSSSISKVYDRWTIICLIIASINILNGLWMIVAPEHWYYNLPAGVPEFGPVNVHFIRDIGCIFFLLGIGLIFAAFYLSYRLPLFTMNTGFYILHMLVHVHEVVSGRIRLSMFWVDLPGVYIPAIISFILNIFIIKQFQKKRHDTIY
ncbi:unnamed protein product [Rotaria sordida]|uniref:Uncharacterized protein n=1 Tax=Rotaria sordida TaxID=392033 RepID=A0A818RZI5_9BILA|nr:unnamed protein product [Rotaria sordida]CAF0985811.1 unnamed protein product [Rotaria sordida]CAF1051886.1 unnamed protein product [Rotaria sordida]CAF3665557.1 unnamed protein product [Rotaria sordida]